MSIATGLVMPPPFADYHDQVFDPSTHVDEYNCDPNCKPAQGILLKSEVYLLALNTFASLRQ